MKGEVNLPSKRRGQPSLKVEGQPSVKVEGSTFCQSGGVNLSSKWSGQPSVKVKGSIVMNHVVQFLVVEVFKI